MAKSKRKRKLAASHKNQEKSFFKIVGIVTILLLILLYFIFRSSS